MRRMEYMMLVGGQRISKRLGSNGPISKGGGLECFRFLYVVDNFGGTVDNKSAFDQLRNGRGTRPKNGITRMRMRGANGPCNGSDGIRSLHQ